MLDCVYSFETCVYYLYEYKCKAYKNETMEYTRWNSNSVFSSNFQESNFLLIPKLIEYLN